MRKERLRGVLFLIVTVIGSTLIQAQTYELKAIASVTEQRVNGEISFILGVSDLADAYFISLEAGYDADALEFLSEEPVGLTAGGLSVSNAISSGLLGASATRTTPLAAPDSGDLIKLNFRIKGTASPGLQNLVLNNLQFSDSNGEVLESQTSLTVEFTVLEDIGDLSISGDPVISVTEGENYILNAQVFSSGVTDQGSENDRIRVWAGVRPENTDPAGWEESSWVLLDFDQVNGDRFIYSGEIAFGRAVGIYSVALRSDLDQSGNFHYGGVAGFWDPVNSPSAELEIQERGPYRYVLAEWDFNNEELHTSTAIPDNQGQELELFGASLSGFSAGVTGFSANSNGWNDFAENTKYWLIKVSTLNFESIQISSAQMGSNTGPRDFQLQFSTDSLSWTDVNGGSITVRNDNFSSGLINELNLPAAVNNQPVLYLRWLQTSGFRVDDTDGVSSTGTNRIDDIRITGINPNASRVTVWPGDTDNNSVVDAADVLPLGIWWLSQGPLPVYPGINWQARETEAWIPEAATYADADGSGSIDQNDLKPIGLNFGDSRTAGKIKDEYLAEIIIPRMKKGEEIKVVLRLKNKKPMSGYAAEFEIKGIQDLSLEADVEYPVWMQEWADKGSLLSFDSVRGDLVSSAGVYKGSYKGVMGSKVLTLGLKAKENREKEGSLFLKKLALVSSEDIQHDIRDVIMELGKTTGNEEESGLPESTELLPNYPNPFNPLTNISYRTHRAGKVSITIYNALGQKVARPVDEFQGPGNYTVPFSAHRLSSGIYLYELRVADQRFVRKMMLVK
ncbi:T9SS type A sorting domain-containing protein [Balneola sp. MJW-20]|uniref:T9SS type A sorting domain-containing protein n=1 Tax=Gracilimonas aurantiaca TaxID=3234185 RepID=UPI0034663F3E